MPYKLFKVEGGYKVGLVSALRMSNNKRYLSNRPLTRKEAVAQLAAVNIRENMKVKKKVKKK